MPRICQTCTHPSRSEIDQRLAAGEADTDVARLYGLTKVAIYRHRTQHLGSKKHAPSRPEPPPRDPAAQILASVQRAQNAVRRLPTPEKLAAAHLSLGQRASKLMTTAEQQNDVPAAVQAGNLVNRTLDSIGRVAGITTSNPPAQVDVTVNVNLQIDVAVQQILATLDPQASAPPAQLVQLADGSVTEDNSDPS
jgi:hypothetical protein